jgi:hypothetical protein
LLTVVRRAPRRFLFGTATRRAPATTNLNHGIDGEAGCGVRVAFKASLRKAKRDSRDDLLLIERVARDASAKASFSC